MKCRRALRRENTGMIDVNEVGEELLTSPPLPVIQI